MIGFCVDPAVAFGLRLSAMPLERPETDSENLAERLKAQRDEARHIAELLWKEADRLAKLYAGRKAPAPPRLPWASDLATITTTASLNTP